MSLATESNIQQNNLSSIGLYQPYSESLTHARLYALNMNIQLVIHAHSIVIWSHTKALKLPYISAKISCGTLEMANEVMRLYRLGSLQNTPLFSILVREDGVDAFGDNIER